MNNLTLIEILVVSCLATQMVVVFLALVAYADIEDKKAWKYFILATTFIVLRRLLSVIGYTSPDLKSLESETVITILISFLFIVYIFQKTNWLRKIKK